MAQDSYPLIFIPYLEVTMLWGDPTINYLDYFHFPFSKEKKPRCLFPSISSIAFDPYTHIIVIHYRLL